MDINRDMKTFWNMCIPTIEEIKRNGLTGVPAKMALLESAKLHENQSIRNIAIALENEDTEPVISQVGHENEEVEEVVSTNLSGLIELIEEKTGVKNESM